MERTGKHIYSKNGKIHIQGVIHRSELLVCYEDLEEIKGLSDDDQIVSRTTAVIWRYKSMYESVRIANGLSLSMSTTGRDGVNDGLSSPNTLSNRPNHYSSTYSASK